MIKNITLLAFLVFLCQIPLHSQTHNWTDNLESSRSFIENKGQFDGRNWDSSTEIQFAYSQNPFYIFFTDKGVTYRFDKVIKNPKRDKQDPKSPKRTNISELITAEWIGANPNVIITAENELNHFYSYAIKDFSSGNVSNQNNVRGFARITYKNLYDNIDVEYTIHPEGGVKYNVILHPGADPTQVQLKYSTASTTTGSESINFGLNSIGQLEINTSLGQLLEHKPHTYYTSGQEEIQSKYKLENNTLSFDIANFDSSKEVVIDPWIVSPTFTTSTAVWEVETDGAGNVYTIGGETPMELKKYNAAGTLQWTYTSPWDTATVWLGTLATDAGGTSYITSGTTPEIERIDNAGTLVWHNATGGGFGQDTEYWTISFNCDKTKLIVGGTKFVGLTDVYAAIFDINITNGNVISDQTFAYTNIFGGIGATPEEVRSISSARNAKFIYLTHNQVGAINSNLASCPTIEPTYQVDNTHHLGYKCENYLPATQNGGGLKALIANDNFFYTHSGDEIHQWDLNTGAQINTVTLVGGVSTTVPFIGGMVVENSGLAVDDCGNVYAGSKDRVVKFDPNLNVLSTSTVSFNVYDVSVNANGEVLAVGAQIDNSGTNRNGRIESLAMSACAQYTLVCCDANFCNQDDLCETDAPVTLIPNTAGGTWSGPGVNSSTGVFDPSVAGPGTHTITYTLACGDESQDITVAACVSLEACEESNGDYTVTTGTGPYTWYEYSPASSTPITNQTQCTACGYTWQGFPLNQCLNGFTPATSCNSPAGYVTLGTGATITPGTNFPIKVVDANGDSLVISAAGTLVPCNPTTCAPPTLATSITNVTCTGGANGAIDLTITGTSTYSIAWDNSATTEDISGLSANTYTVIVTDQVDGTCTATTTVTVNDGTQPTVVANASTTNACVGDMITLTGSGASTYAWDNGVTDGTPFAAVTTTTYTVTGTDGSGCINTASVTVNVTTCTTPNASFTPSTTSICEGDCIDFTNTSTNIPPGSLLGWNFPGSSTPNSTTTNPTNICYPTAGTYWVTQIYTDATFTLVDSTGMAIDVTVCNVDPPIADFSASNVSFCEGDCIDFTDLSTSTATGGITSWSWDFGNGATSVLQNPTNICYATAGTYDVSLTVTDANGSHTETKVSYVTVTVCAGPLPVADFSASNTSLCEGDCIDFTDLSTSSAAGITAWSWNFGNGQTSTLQNPTNICYTNAGSYAVSLTVTDANGNDTETKTSYIVVTTCVGPSATFNVVPGTTICEGDCIGFVNTSTNVPPGSFIGWNFPGATPSNSTVNSPSNICYNTAGSYWVTLVITDASFNVLDSSGVAITVTTCVPPVAGFTFSPSGPFCANSCITFTSNSTYNTPATFSWDFGNGQGNNSENPGAPICFATAGTYQVSLTVTDANGSNTETQTIVIEDCTPPTAGFTMSSSAICEGQCIFFNNSSINGTFYQWTFEGGSPPASYVAFPGDVCFNDEGNYTITLVAGNNYGSDTITSQVTVNPSPNVQASDDQSIFSSQEVQIQSLSSDPNVTYVWSPTDWLDCPDCPVTTVAPQDTTLYVITVTNQYGCSDSADVLVMVEYIEEIGVPSAFSPNGDGFNDVLYVQGSGIKNMEFKVYNRYGQVVFESTDQEYGWDGTFQGKEENTGVFVYYVIYDNSTSEGNVLEGNVTLIR